MNKNISKREKVPVGEYMNYTVNQWLEGKNKVRNKLRRKKNEEVYSEYTPVELKRHKKQENDQ